MSSSLRPRLTLVAALLTSSMLGGCYVGAELEDDSFGAADPTGAGPGPTPQSTTIDPTTGEDPGASSTGQTSGDASGDASSGGVVDETTGDGTTGAQTTDPVPEPMTTDPSTTTDAGDETTTDDPEMPPPPPVDVPDNGFCGDVAAPAAGWAQLELDVLEIVNQVRAQGANCGSKGAFGPAGPLTMDPALRCAARKHSADMAARNFFDHTNPDGESPWDRMGKAGYGNYSNAGENIAAGSPDAQGTMDQWMGSDGHCANIMNPSFEHIGIGYSTGGQYGHLWTQVFGAK